MANQTKMPDEVLHALLEILYYTLISIRSEKNTELTFVLSDHAHNIPHLIGNYTPGRFRYYWEAERPDFLQAMEQLDQPVDFFRTHWAALEKHYEILQMET